MKLATALPIALLAAAVAAPALAAGGPATTGALPVPANRIVGTWSNVAAVGPCTGVPGAPQRQTIMFDAGGTFLDNPRFPPTGMPNLNGITGTHQRSIGMGTWSYDPSSGQYIVDQQFDWYVNGQYHGYQTIHRSIQLSNDGNTAAGPVLAVRYAADGAVVFEACGSAVSTRI